MGLKRTLLRPVASLAGHHAAGQLRRFRRATADVVRCQERLVRELVRAFGQADYGRSHGLDRVRTLADFRKALPLADYDDFAPYVDRLRDGDATALLPADWPVLMFSMTSGTTGEPKYIPVTQRFLSDIRRGWNAWGVNALLANRRAWLRPIVQITSRMDEAHSPAGAPCGAISGLLAATQKKIVRRMYVVPRWIAQVSDPTVRFYTALRLSITHDVSFVTTANPSSTIKLIETGQQHIEQLIRDVRDGTLIPPADDGLPAAARNLRLKPNPRVARRLEAGLAADGHFLPRHAWGIEFLGNWTGGTLRLYLKRLRELFGEVPIYDIGLVASEGRFSIPFDANTPAGLAEVTGNVLEFIPVEERTNETPRTLRVDELDAGCDYFLVFSNFSGLLRYNLDDRVRVTGHVDGCPVFEFVCRGVQTASITGEKITERQVVEAMGTARTAFEGDLDRFELQGCFETTPYYELRVEAEPDHAERLAADLDDALCGLNIEYASKRKSGRLGPIRPAVVPTGTFEQAEREKIAARNGRSEQYKHRYLITEVQQPAN